MRNTEIWSLSLKKFLLCNWVFGLFANHNHVLVCNSPNDRWKKIDRLFAKKVISNLSRLRCTVQSLIAIKAHQRGRLAPFEMQIIFAAVHKVVKSKEEQQGSYVARLGHFIRDTRVVPSMPFEHILLVWWRGHFFIASLCPHSAQDQFGVCAFLFSFENWTVSFAAKVLFFLAKVITLFYPSCVRGTILIIKHLLIAQSYGSITELHLQYFFFVRTCSPTKVCSYELDEIF